MSAPFVDMGVKGHASGLGIAFITNNVLLDLELSAMEKTGNGEIISQPKVVTSDKETAKILKGTEIPYQETSDSSSNSRISPFSANSVSIFRFMVHPHGGLFHWRRKNSVTWPHSTPNLVMLERLISVSSSIKYIQSSMLIS